ncbi:nonribosomal siderophore peptide synthase SidC [Aspergillus stella-maris]|uniref:nonribosomal siderophore peptide synthase SidC n=1 Tax=Aspergillus stella-maris TaxID=1810926 RepID=UPI003CCD853F
MGKRRIAGSVRRCVASSLSRVTRSLFHNNNEERQTTSKDPDSNGTPAAASKLNYLPPELLPATKVPALDTTDAYAVDRPIEEHASGASQQIKLACSSCSSDAPSLIDGLNRGYARFVSSLTGLEDVAICSTRRLPFVASKPFTSIVVASGIKYGEQNNFDIREVNATHHDEDEIQFYAEMGPVGPENGRHKTSSHKNGFTLHVELDNKKSAMYISFTYPKWLIPPTAIEQLLRTLSSNISQSCPSLAISTPEPAPSILNFPSSMIPPATNFNGIETSPSDSYILHAAFEDWARRHPHAIALDFIHSLGTETSPPEHSTLSYAALDTAASYLALHITSLLSSGRPATYGRIIPVNMPTSPELYISYLAILKAGHAFCPIPQDVPLQRKEEILRDIGSPVVLGNTPQPPESGTINHTLELTPTWVDVSSVSRWKELQGDWNPSFPSAPESLQVPSLHKEQTAYLLFTSGSTGKPKGVQVSHLAASCSIASHATAIPLPGKLPGDFRWFQFASPSFDPSLMEIFVTLSSGGTLCSADRRLTLSNLEATVNEARATIMMATPSLATLLRPSHLETLEALWSMGEKLTRTVIDNFALNHETNGNLETSRPKTLVNAYGPTEGAINCTYVASFGRYMRGSIIGKPLPTCAMFVLSPDSQEPTPVPVGTVGELAIGGPQVSKGYLNRPDETAKSFIHTEKFGYIYRTGDKARIVWDADGSEVIEYLGRISTDQVKINGRRIELGEIESVIAAVSGVQEVVVVIAKKDGKSGGSEQIVACLVAEQATKTEKGRIIKLAKENAAQHLNPSNCPSSYRFLDALPRSSSGKVDRKALSAAIQKGDVEVPVVNGDTPEKEDIWIASEDEDLLPLQHLVIQLIAETAGEEVSAIKPETELYSMGLDSLGAMRFLQRLKDHGVDGMSVSDVLQSQTCQALVTLIQQHHTKHDSQSNDIQTVVSKDSFSTDLQLFNQRNRTRCAKQLDISPHTIEDVLPTTATQSGMLASFLRSLADKSYAKPTYIYHTALELQHHIDIPNLEKAWNDLVTSYDSLRTVFCMVDDALAPFAQCVLTSKGASKQEWDVYTSPNEIAAENSLKQALRKAEETISLERPPWKLSLVKSPTHSVLVLSMFHGIFDGGSLKLLLNDVFAAYTEKIPPQRTLLNHLVKHHFQADHASTSRFWNDYLQGYTPVPFPSITPDRAPTQKSSGCVEITSNLSHGTLKILSKSIGSTPLSVLQAAWGAILLSYTATPDQDVVIGSVVSGRLDQDSRDCIGPTFTITPLRISLQQLKKHSNALTNKNIVRYLSSSNAKALSHLQPQLGSITADGQLPYDTVLAYQDFGLDAEYSQLWSSIDHPAMANDFSVMVEVTPEADSSLTLRATYDTKLDSAAAELMLRQMDDLIDYILRHPEENFEDAPLQAHFDLKSTANPTALTAPEVSEGALLHTQFEEHAASHPDDLALIFKQDLDHEEHEGNISWTYGQLNAMADELAEHLLRTCGDLTDASVPICIEKTPALYVAILGILKAGGAWCPIDTLSPAQRRHDLIARTSAGVLLVSELDGAQPETAIPANVKIIDVSQFTRTRLTNQDRQTTTHRATPANTAYLIWTSGTTGAPKGVPITHSAGVSSMKSLQADIPGNADGSPVRCLQFSQYTFDVSIQDLFYTWGIGGVLISGTREIMLESFSTLANLTHATHAHLTPAFASGVPRKSCKTLKVITMIGEKLTQSVADDWGTDMKAYNTYGPAEVTVVSTIREFGNEHKSIKSANIGWPMKSVSVFVMKNHSIVMKNAIGELALGGPQLSPGYLNQKDVTDAKYVWNEEAGQRLYYTGDLVRMLSDGSLEYITRVDDLVKLGGIRIELSEISFAMRGCSPLVETIETLILSRPDRPTQVVVAFLCAPKMAGDAHDGLLVLNNGGRDVARAATNQARNTPSAKVDRRALQAAYASVDLEKWENDVNPEDPASDSEDEQTASVTTQVIDFVAALVGVEASTITKPNRLRSLGIDSLRATRLAFRLKEAGHSLSVIDVLACVTVQDLIKLARASGPSDNSPSVTFDVQGFDKTWRPAVAERINEDFTSVRATAVQESLLTETMGSYKMYWSNHFLQLDRSVDVSRLKQAWFAVCQKTEALRTGFIPVADIPSPEPNGNLDYSILQLIYKLPAVDFEYQKCTEEESTGVLDGRIDDVMMRSQKDYFRSPPWAVTILDKGHERVMVFTVHHSVHDEPSLQFIMDDVRSAYAYKPPLRRQLNQALSVVLANEHKYAGTVRLWQSELKAFAELDVPVWPDLTGKRVPPGVTPEYRLITEEVPMTESVQKLQSITAELGLQSVASIVRAAWAFVSLSYLGLPATVFAETLSDRVLDSSLESTVGPFISVVPFPFRPDGTVRNVLKEQHRVSAQSWKHRHVHARDIRKALQRPRGEPLYPAVFNFHAVNEKKENHSLPDLWQELEDQVGLHVEHPMAINVFQNPNNALTLEVSSDSRIFSREHLRLFVRQIDCLITAMLTSLDEPFPDLVSRLPSELRSLSNREVSPEVANSIYQPPTYWLEKYADSRPDWTAVEVASKISMKGIEKEPMSYATLNGKANQVAAYLSSFGYKNRVIGVSCSRTLESYPIIIGIFKSGNTYLPIDESLPNDRKTFLLEDSNSPLVFTETQFAPSFFGAPDSCSVASIDDQKLQKSISHMPSQTQNYESHPDDNSYLLFTSGSTGKPKGVMITRANLSSFIESISEFACQIAPDTLKLGGTGRYLAQTNRAFDPHLLEMFFPWRHGMATVTAPRPMILDDIGTTLSKWDITHASFVPSLVDQSNITPEQCPKLRFMTVGGEKITQKVLDTWASAPNVAIVNAYGPTEVTIGCTFAHINSSTNLRNIGRPLTACKAHVLIPDTMNYALRGQTGELCFSGDLVGRGYLNRPDAKGFLTGPDGVKIYRTGDIGRLMADDSVEYLGRGDDQTKIRGQRLELGEVSEALRASSPVPIDVVTTVAKHPSLAKVQLLSFVSRSQRGHGKDISFLYSDFSTLGRELQEICRSKLPAFMVPELILPITSIPVAPMSGKANMKELHQLFSELPLQTVLQGNSASGAAAASQRPLSSEEEVVVNEICHVISTDRGSFGPLTNIFEIGLDSLSAIGLSIRLRNAGYAATVALVMSNPVIEQLARLPKSSTTTESNSSSFQQRCKDLEIQYCEAFSTTMKLSHVQAVRPCLPLQEGLIARSLNSDSDQLYINHVTLQLADGVDAERLKAAWQAVVKENDILRTAFASLEKEIAQVVFRTGSDELFTESEYANLEYAIQGRKYEQPQISKAIIADISIKPPVRLQFARSSSEKRPLALFIAIHHALYDGESFAMMLEDVAARYEGKQPVQRGSPSAFLEIVCLQDTDKAKQHWTRALSGANPTVIRSNPGIGKTMSASRNLNAKLSDLEACSAALQTTVPNLMQAMFALLLADYVGSSDITYGLVLSGRTISTLGADSVLLPCITTVPARLNTNDLDTVVDVVNAIQRSTVRSLDFQHTPLRKIQQWLKSETQLFDCLFSYIRASAPAKHGLWNELKSHMPSEYPLALEVQADSARDVVNLECIFSSDFGFKQDIEEFLEKMDAVLSDLCSGGTISLNNFNLAQSKTSGMRTPAENWDESSWSATETKIRELTSTFCGLEPENVSKGASFFSLGIDSVTAIQFARKLRAESLKASSSDIMHFSCVGALARHIDGVSSSPQVNGVIKQERGILSTEKYAKHIPLLGVQDSLTSMFECTPLQSGMITQTISSGGKVYVNPHPIRLNDSVDIEKLMSALRQVIAMNEILRTSFHLILEHGDSWIGAVHAYAPFDWTEITLSSSANVLNEVIGLFEFDQETSFQTPPIRCVLVHQPECKILVIILHHSLYDGASLPFVFEDLVTFYADQYPATRLQFSEVVPYVLSDQEKACDYWTTKLQGFQPTEIPLLPSPSTSRMLATEHGLDLDISKVTAACKEMEVTIHSVSFLAYAKVYAKLLGTRDVVFGQVLAGRTLSHPDADRTLGPLFNTVAQRVTLDPKFPSNRTLALRLQQQTTESQQHQHAPLQTIQKSMRQNGQLESTTLFDALFVFQKSAALSGGVLDGQNIWTPYEADDYVVDTEYKLNVEVDHRHDGIIVTATCNGLYIDQEMLERFVHDFEEVFKDIIEHPTRCATTIPQGLGELPLQRTTTYETPVADDSDAPEHEDLLRTVLANVTGIPIEEIRPNTSIFNLGLDSLSAIRFASTCRGKGLKISVGDILQGNTLRGISLRVKATATSSAPSQEPLTKDYSDVQQQILRKLNLTSAEVETILPCLPGQTHHLASWLKSGRKLFEPAWSFASSQRIDGAKLQDAWLKLRNRHPVLRTVFVTTSESEPVQVVMKSAADNTETFKTIEYSSNIADLAKVQAREEALQPSSLTAPPIRLRLLKAADKDGILVIIHHSLYDAWTMPMIVSELGKLYQGEKPTINPDFLAFVDHSLRVLGSVDEKNYWTKALMPSKPTILKGSGTSPNPDQLFVSAWEKVKNLSAMEAACRRSGLSLQTIILLAVARCLANTTGVASPIMGLYQTGRSASFNDIENLSGPCLNVNPFVVPDAAKEDSVVDQAKAIQDVLAERVSYEQSSLRDILNWVNHGNRSPLFNTWVNLLWMQNSIPPSANLDTNERSDDNLFTPLPIGVPTDFIPSDQLPPQKTPVDDLDTSYLPDQNIFLDIGPDPKTDTIGFGVRVEGGFLSEGEVRNVIDGVANEIEAVVSAL